MPLGTGRCCDVESTSMTSGNKFVNISWASHQKICLHHIVHLLIVHNIYSSRQPPILCASGWLSVYSSTYKIKMDKLVSTTWIWTNELCLLLRIPTLHQFDRTWVVGCHLNIGLHMPWWGIYVVFCSNIFWWEAQDISTNLFPMVIDVDSTSQPRPVPNGLLYYSYVCMSSSL